jgi:hypothetical protein
MWVLTQNVADRPHSLRSVCSRHTRGFCDPTSSLFGEPRPIEAQLKLQTVLQCGLDMANSIGTASVFPYVTAPMYTPEIPAITAHKIQQH